MQYSPYSIHPNIRTRVLRAGIAAGGLREWDFAWNKFLTTESASEKSALMYALAFSRTPWVLNRYVILYIFTRSIILKEYIK